MEAIILLLGVLVGVDFYLKRKTGLHLHQWGLKKYQEIQNKTKDIKAIDDKQSL